MGSEGALVITVGQGRTSPRGSLLQVPNGVMGLAQALESLPAVSDSWWSAHSWAGAYRKQTNWQAAGCIALDIDYYEGENHSLQPPHVVQQLDAFIRSGNLPGNIVYVTPRGFRLIFVLEGQVTDPERYQGIVREISRQVGAAVQAGGLEAHKVDEAAAYDLARLLFSPRAVVDGVPRQHDVLVLREQLYPLPEVSPDAEVFEVVTSGSADLDAAVKKYNEANKKDYPKNRGDCPICKHRGCFGALPGDTSKWACFSSNHQGAGRKGTNCWFGDVLDIDAFSAGKLPVSYLKSLSLFASGEAARGPASVSKLPGADERELKSNSYASICFALREPSLREKLVGAGTLEFDERRLVPTLDREPLGEFASVIGEIRERAELHLGSAPYKGYKFKKTDVEDALMQVAREHAFHPVQEYLKALEWDGVSRLEKVARDLLPGAGNDLNATLVRKWFISAVARAMEPGCKVDSVLILTGPQGIGKSTFFSTLASSAWFTDSAMSLGNKDAYMLMHRSWIVEWAELESMQRARDQNAVKAFITSGSDCFRPPYGRETIDFPRRCVIVGTTNDREFLADPTGERRYWVVEVTGSIPLEKVKEQRDQLWAEALAMYRRGESWFLSIPESRQLKASQEEFKAGDAWKDAVEKFATAQEKPFGVSDVLTGAINKQLGQWTKGDEMRIGKIMKELPFGKRRVDGRWKWVKLPGCPF